MNVAVINLRDILRYLAKICFAVFIVYLSVRAITASSQTLKQALVIQTNGNFLTKLIDLNLPQNTETKEESKLNLNNIMNMELALFNTKPKENIISSTTTNVDANTPKQEEIKNIQTTLPRTANTEAVSDRNFSSRKTHTYNTTNIDNQSDYTLTEEMLVPDVDISNKKDIIIYHTHTCESYTPSEAYNYTMTGNYRTTDANYNVIRVGTELTNYLAQKGFNVIHDGSYNDYPSYSGSYDRSLEVASRLIDETPSDIVLDIHRDAVGNGDTYGPTIMIDGNRVAQMMFVIGTDGGGLEHPNWNQNLKIAIKIQEKANQMYPGLFRSIVLRNSRYNQHVAKGASIIEVGATANTLEECLLSMQCLANVLEEVCK